MNVLKWVVVVCDLIAGAVCLLGVIAEPKLSTKAVFGGIVAACVLSAAVVLKVVS